ncbi:MAG TPA: aconitate hydratase AcnA [candidate division Zixibacteria bacterium]|nr:aconitate hydratase AcnA [candidate division Zixibacteria bacterium]
MSASLNTLKTLPTAAGERSFHSFAVLEAAGVGANLAALPNSIKILLESALRNLDGFAFTEEHISQLANWSPNGERVETPFLPARIILQDFTGVPAVVDLAAMRSALARLGGDPKKIQPKLPVDLVIDHSVQVDSFGLKDALLRNEAKEFERNRERYEFLKWGQQSIAGLRVAPPSMGIVHQVNLEYLGQVVFTDQTGTLVYPDSLVGTDSHTPMINGLGVLGWGVGGIEAEATMLGQPMSMLIPDVIGVKLTGSLPEGATATDLVLVITELLRKKGVVGKFVEFYGAGLSNMTLPDRATISNMSPEQGSTVGFFPVDNETLRYLRLTGRPEKLIDLVERYTKEQGLFRTDETPDPQFSDTVELDLSTVEPSLAGPRRPHDRLRLSNVAGAFNKTLPVAKTEGGFGVPESALDAKASIRWDKESAEELRHGSVVIAAITSCTNTSNPSVMLAAGLLAKKAAERGLTVPHFVKTSLAPGSQVVTAYLEKAGLLPYLEQLGFYVVAYGCTTCIGNSGPLPEPVVDAINDNDLVAAAVLSGNRNFEGRVSPHTRANYLASPPLVVAYALAGNVDIDLTREPLGRGSDDQPVFLGDIWPSGDEIKAAVEASVSREMFIEKYKTIWDGSAEWNAISGSASELYDWNENSTYIQEPPFFTTLTAETQPVQPLRGMRPLALFGDTITTDHISPAGSIPADGPAGQYLQSLGIRPKEFNSFGARRGNDRVMIRGTFGNIRIKNRMVSGVEGGYTLHQPDGKQMSIYDAAMKYQQEKTPLIIIAGKEYGSGSSRDWAAKGTYLLGVKAVLAETFERIHRSNLVGMGVLPLQFAPGESIDSHQIDGSETFDLLDLDDSLQPQQQLTVRGTRADGSTFEMKVTARIDTPVEVNYYRNGGILHAALRAMARG